MKSNNKKQEKPNPHKFTFLSSRIFNIIFAVIFAGTAYWLLAIDGANYLRKVDLLSIFLPTKDYLRECMALPGGLLTWLSTYLIQMFYYPWLGGAIYTIILLCIAYLCRKAFKLYGRLTPTAFIIPALVLLAFLNLGYVIFSLKTPGAAYLLPLGLCFTILLFWLYRCINRWWIRAILIIAYAIAGYCLMGFYGLLTVGLCCVYELFALIFSRGKRCWMSVLSIIIGAISVYMVPKLWFQMIGGDMMMVQIYRWPLPRLVEGESNIWRMYNWSFAILGILALCTPIKRTDRIYNSLTLGVVSAAVWVLAIVFMFTLRYQDDNFRLTLDLDHNIWEQDWHGAIERVDKSQDFNPTRVNVMMTDIALLRLNQLGDKAFTYKIASEQFNTARELRATHDIASRMISLHTGLINYAYRWGMEYKVEYGLNVEELKYMTKAAILNGDFAIARKCLDNLSLTMFHRKWADKYRKYLDDPSLIDQDEEFAQILQTLDTDDEFIVDNGTLESYIWTHIAKADTTNFKQFELSLIADLIVQDIAHFGERIAEYASRTDHLPVHFQEAILMWSTIDDNFDYHDYKIDREVLDNFNRFMTAAEACSKRSEDVRKQMLRPNFGDTYWYYYLYTVNNRII